MSEEREGERERESIGYYIFLFIIYTSLLQISLLGLQIIWTMDSTNALKNARSDRKIMAATDQAFLDILNSPIEMTMQETPRYVWS